MMVGNCNGREDFHEKKFGQHLANKKRGLRFRNTPFLYTICGAEGGT